MTLTPKDGLPLPQRYGAIATIIIGISMAVLDGAIANVALPTIAAAILSVASWQWLFLINVPLGIVALVFALRYLPANRPKSSMPKFDLPSAVMNALTFGLLITALSGFAQGQSLPLIAGEVVALLVVGFFFVRRQLALPVPLLPVDLLRIPLFSLSIGTSICSFCAQMLALVSLPFFLQSVIGRSEVETGLLLTPWPLATMVMAPLAGYLIERVHAGLLGALGMVVMAAGLFALALLPAAPHDLDIIWRMILCGAGFGLFQSPNNHTIITAAPPHRSGGASGMLGTARLLGQSTGAALVALLFNLAGQNGTHLALLTAGTLAALAAIISGLRVTQPRPQA